MILQRNSDIPAHAFDVCIVYDFNHMDTLYRHGSLDDEYARAEPFADALDQCDERI